MILCCKATYILIKISWINFEKNDMLDHCITYPQDNKKFVLSGDALNHLKNPVVQGLANELNAHWSLKEETLAREKIMIVGVSSNIQQQYKI